MAVAEENEKEGGEAPPKKSKKKLFIIVGAVVLLAIIGGVAAIFMGGGKKAAEGEGAELAEEQRKELHLQTARLDTFIVNLSESSAFVKITLLLEYDPAIIDKASGHTAKGGAGGYGGGGTGGATKAESGGMPSILKDREPMIRDAIIRVISSKTATEVLSVEGKEKLKEEIIEASNEAIGLDEAPVVNVYFVEFIIQ